jgi:seryl-tRNA synthetase
LQTDKQWRAALTQVEELKAKVNSASREIGQLMKSGDRAAATAKQENVRQIKAEIEENEAKVRGFDAEVDAWLTKVPNLPADDVPPGKEEQNVIISTVGDPPAFDFEPRPHWEIADKLGLIDFERGTKISGSGFVAFRGLGARLERALISFMLDTHREKHGFTEWSTPFFLNRDSMTASAHIVKFLPEMYHDDESDLFALPTAEPALVNLHRDEILRGEDLPLKYVAYSPCWRREAGSAGKDTRGLLRVHQFDKVEMVKVTAPETSYDELDKMVEDALDIIRPFGLTYRIVKLAAGDMSFSAAKCFDIEIYAPGCGQWLEVSSCSNCLDFQARRANIRFRRSPGAKPEFAHLLNGSGTALPRLMAAVLETYQQADGTVRVPDVLRPYLGGLQSLT